jgi:hypothetical protein
MTANDHSAAASALDQTTRRVADACTREVFLALTTRTSHDQ